MKNAMDEAKRFMELIGIKENEDKKPVLSESFVNDKMLNFLEKKKKVNLSESFNNEEFDIMEFDPKDFSAEDDGDLYSLQEDDEFDDDPYTNILKDPLVLAATEEAGLEWMAAEDPEGFSFDVADAIYIYTHDFNDNTDTINELKGLLRKYGHKPSSLLNSREDLEEYGQEMYDAFVALYEPEYVEHSAETEKYYAHDKDLEDQSGRTDLNEGKPSRMADWLNTHHPENKKEILSIMANAGTRRSADDAMRKINDLVGGYGVEAIRADNMNDSYWMDAAAIYVNMGDTYSATILYDIQKQKFMLTTMGDFVEYYKGGNIMEGFLDSIKGVAKRAVGIEMPSTLKKVIDDAKNAQELRTWVSYRLQQIGAKVGGHKEVKWMSEFQDSLEEKAKQLDLDANWLNHVILPVVRDNIDGGQSARVWKFGKQQHTGSSDYSHW